jgi:hypothetical protein
MGIWKLLLAILVILCLIVGLPYILGTFGMAPPFTYKRGLILGVIAIGIVFKTIFGDMISGKFEYYKQGYDLCILTLGASLSLLALQIVSDTVLFQSILQTGWSNILKPFSDNEKSQILILLFGIFLSSCILSLVTARIGMAIRDDDQPGKNYLSILNFFLGAVIFWSYILLMISKE